MAIDLTKMTILELVYGAVEMYVGSQSPATQDEFIYYTERYKEYLAEARRRDALPKWEPVEDGHYDYPSAMETSAYVVVEGNWLYTSYDDSVAALPDDVRLCRLSGPTPAPQ